MGKDVNELPLRCVSGGTNTKGLPQFVRQPRIYGSLQIFLHCLGRAWAGSSEMVMVKRISLAAPNSSHQGHESLSGCPVLADEFVQALNEHMGVSKFPACGR